MECPACATPVAEEQKFCHECGASLHGVTDATQPLTVLPVPDSERPVTDRPDDDRQHAGGADPTPVTGATTRTDSGAASGTDGAFDELPSETTDPADPRPAPTDLPDIGDLPTQEIRPRPPLPDPEWSPPPLGEPPRAPRSEPAAAAAAAPTAGPELFDDLTTPTPAHPVAAITDDLPPPDDVHADAHHDASATTQLRATAPPAAVTSGEDDGDATTVLAAAPGARGATDEYPAVFDGIADVAEYPEDREPFRLRLVFVLAFFGAVAALMVAVADLTDIRTTRPIDGILTGITTIDDVGSNLALAGFVGGTVMALGGLLACFGFRWGAGLAGGAGLAVLGWAGLVIGLAEVPIARAEEITRTSTEPFTLKVTRDLGYWLVVAVGVVGLLVFVASLRMFRTGGRAGLNPWIAAVGAVGVVVLAAGPLIPVDNATFENNFRSSAATGDLPTLYFGGRIGQITLILVAGVVGFLLVRAYGLGLAAGGVSVALWLWISSLLEIGDRPLGVAAGNFGATDTMPHAVTTVGMVLTVALLIAAAVFATVRHQRTTPRH